MLIGGLQKTSLLDFPGKVSTVVFTQECNFRCPYCHNPELVLSRREPLVFTEVLAFLAQRKSVLEGVVVSGGEPTLHDGLFDFCAAAKSLGYAVKLDTNGSRPEVLRQLLQAQLLDYVAMDIKADPRHYPEALCPRGAGEDVWRGIAVLEESPVQHEFRVPCVEPFIDTAGFTAIVDEVAHAPIFLQAVRGGNVLRPDFFLKQGRALDADRMEALCAIGRQRGKDCRVR